VAKDDFILVNTLDKQLLGVSILISYRLIPVLLALLLETCTAIPNSVQARTSPSISNPGTQNQHSYRQAQASGANSRTSKPKDPCLNIRRPLNPPATPQRAETLLDRYFRLAYNAEVAGDFDTAIINYRQAVRLATCNCDRLHAQAGEQAAKEAKALLKTEGEASKPTQFFWGRLQELTKPLSCVTVQ
jgi:hypothetical protein